MPHPCEFARVRFLTFLAPCAADANRLMTARRPPCKAALIEPMECALVSTLPEGSDRTYEVLQRRCSGSCLCDYFFCCAA